MAATLRLLLATQRAGVDSYFRALPTGGETELTVQHVPLDPGAVKRAAAPDHATVAVVDVDGHHETAVEVVQHLRARRRELPVVALICCSHGLQPATLRELSDVGVKGMVDLHATPEQTWETLTAAASGDLVVHVRLGDRAAGLRQLLAGDDDADSAPPVRLTASETRVLQLLSEGHSDAEMASRLYLSAHTIKHRVEELRRKVGARNRIALAAWAGRHGFMLEPEEPSRR